MSETQELNEQLERECYNYPPDLEKMQKLVDMGADVNAVYDDRSESLLGWIIYNYLSEVTIDGFDQMEDSPCQDICEVLCQGKTVNGRDGKYFDSIIRFFFKNGYDIGRKYDTGYSEESFAKDLFGYLPYACNGNGILKTLNYILSHIQSPDTLCVRQRRAVRFVFGDPRTPRSHRRQLQSALFRRQASLVRPAEGFDKLAGRTAVSYRVQPRV